MSRRGENIYKRKDGRWEGRYIKGRHNDGKARYGYVYAYSYKAVRNKLLPLKNQYLQETKTIPAKGKKVQKVVETWLLIQQETLKDSTYATYCYKMERYVLPIIGQFDITKLNHIHIQEMVNTWKNQLKISSTTIRNTFQIIKKCLSFAAQNGYLIHNINLNIRLPKSQKKAVRAISLKEQKKLESVALQDKNGYPILFALYTGMRIGEIAALKWSDIDLKNKVIKVNHTYQRIQKNNAFKKTMLILTDTKTNTSQRLIPISKRLADILNRLKHESSSEYLFVKNNKPMEPRLIGYHFKKIADKAGLLNIHFHQLRHTFATRCMEAKGDIASISRLLGHASAKMTLDIYINSLLIQRKLLIKRMDRLMA
ncbi:MULTISPECIES: site-specific integrase [unclassified Enterococcus]|uniref:tyrosine-type recombinase/integrase n=1 Tax=unclassified Enterococcus TaxID=2608891 RepID=UPI0015552AB9|nr:MULTISPECIES: site-specific integrase [unclassified Enterococcus]MBS7577584.1 tyrosine-type recombinase/integrase [Enterococcus sp. MMGLQ5-2]MBS7584917.1 tyrosine-type recombinase/integrase [Enterococcus sp. MMGLQ5-1]NPD12772.1 tyrosine-type recombinase/integrase [Enterococcus sp. MMGLQ5-1]NPD37417.1 tyrosine-type recombinase/integrase [Enterococcus sp. MMGLQ5-2]